MKVKVYQRQVEQAPLPNARFTMQSTPENFGAGNGIQLQQAGNALQNSANDMAVIAGKLMKDHSERIDKATARDAINKASEEMIRIEQSIYERRGLDAAGSADLLKKDLEKVRATYLKGLRNDRQKEYFQAFFDSELNRAYKTAYKHEIDQGFKAEIDTLGAQNNMFEQQALMHRLNPEKIEENKILIEANVRRAMKLAGASPETTEQKVAEARHSLHETVYEALLNDSPELAEKYLNEHHAEFNQEKIAGKPAEIQERKKKLVEVREAYQKENSRQNTLFLAELLTKASTTPQELDRWIATNQVDGEIAAAAKLALTAKGGLLKWFNKEYATLEKGKKSLEERSGLKVYADAAEQVIAGDRDAMANIVRQAIMEVSKSDTKTDVQDLGYILKVVQDRMQDWKNPKWDEFSDAVKILKPYGIKASRDFFQKWDKQVGTAIPLAMQMQKDLTFRKATYADRAVFEKEGYPQYIASRAGMIQRGVDRNENRAQKSVAAKQPQSEVEKNATKSINKKADQMKDKMLGGIRV